MVGKKMLANKWIKWYVIPLCLLIFGLGAIILFLSNRFLVLSYPHTVSNFQQFTDQILLKGESVRGEFTATEDNLGIVDVRLDIVSRVPYKAEDLLQFRIKESGSKSWYYQNNYRSGLMYNNPLFPFGFPKVADSKGKKYMFEIKSLKGTKLNGVSLSTREPVFFSTYQADKQALLQDKRALLLFGVKKFTNSLQMIETVFISIVLFLPLVLYLLFVSPFLVKSSNQINKHAANINYKHLKNKFFKNYSYWHTLVTLILLLFILIAIFFLQLTYNLIFIVLVVMWIFVSRNGGAGSSLCYLIGGMFLVIVPIVLVFNTHIAELLAAWSFLFFVAAVGQSLFEFKTSR